MGLTLLLTAGAAVAAPDRIAVVSVGQCTSPGSAITARNFRSALIQRSVTPVLNEAETVAPFGGVSDRTLPELNGALSSARSDFYSDKPEPALATLNKVLEDVARLAPSDARWSLERDMLTFLTQVQLKTDRAAAEATLTRILRVEPDYKPDTSVFPPSFQRFTKAFSSYRPANGSAFSVPLGISNSANAAAVPDVALGYYGFGGAAWQEVVSAKRHVFARAFDPSKNPQFAARTPLDTSSFEAFAPRIGGAANGDLVVVWQETAATGGSISASRYSSSTGTWSSPVTLGSDPTNAPQSPVVAVDPGGNVLATWTQTVGTTGVLFGRRYTKSGGWVPPLAQQPTQLTFGTDSAFASQTVSDGSGRGTVFAGISTATNSYLDYVGFH
jgi:hypothetical protein